MLKVSIKKSNEEVQDRDRALKEVSKLVKTKEKEIYNLQQRLDNSLETAQTLKQNNLDLKKEIKESIKAIQNAEKKTSIELKKSESKIRNLELSEKQKIVSDLNSASSKAGISNKVSALSPAQRKSQTKCTSAITDEISHKPSMKFSTTPKMSSSLAENNNLSPQICNRSTIFGSNLKLPVPLPKQCEKSEDLPSLFYRSDPLKTSPTFPTTSPAASFSTNISATIPPIPVSIPVALLELEDTSPDTIEEEDVDSEALFEHLIPQERHILKQIHKLIQKTIN
jgi:hypothetical protein